MKHMQTLMDKIDPVVDNATKENVAKLIHELDDTRDINIFKAKLRQKGKLTLELEQVFNGGV